MKLKRKLVIEDYARRYSWNYFCIIPVAKHVYHHICCSKQGILCSIYIGIGSEKLPFKCQLRNAVYAYSTEKKICRSWAIVKIIFYSGIIMYLFPTKSTLPLMIQSIACIICRPFIATLSTSGDQFTTCFTCTCSKLAGLSSVTCDSYCMHER